MENIFILAMEYGNEHQKGFAYPDMKDWIEKQIGYPLNQAMESALVQWFLDSYSCVSVKLTESNKIHLHNTYRLNQTTDSLRMRFLRDTWVMNGPANKQYVDYLELKESREQATKAFKISMGSIGIAIFGILASLIFFMLAPKPVLPPYEVKLIENRVEESELTKEVSLLKDKLIELNRQMDSLQKVHSKL